MHTTNSYPCPDKYIGLNCISELRAKFDDLLVGFSDHSEGDLAALGAVSLGACVIEKHFTDTFEERDQT